MDNSFEAAASTVDVRIEEIEAQGTKGLTVRVTDNGTGMPPHVLRLALQFGGSKRFGSRTAAGRYGMGLPNDLLSQARRGQTEYRNVGFDWSVDSRCLLGIARWLSFAMRGNKSGAKPYLRSLTTLGRFLEVRTMES